MKRLSLPEGMTAKGGKLTLAMAVFTDEPVFAGGIARRAIPKRFDILDRV